jgi:hypothetical protein
LFLQNTRVLAYQHKTWQNLEIQNRNLPLAFPGVAGADPQEALF